MNSVLNSFACLTVFTFSVYIILRIVSRSFTAVFQSEEKHVENSSVRSRNCETQEIRRDMGFYESYLAETNTRYGTKIYVVLSLKSAVNLRRENIKNTLSLLARKHQILQANMTTDAQACKRQFMINSDFVPELRFVNTSNWKMILEEELIANSERLETQHFWRTVVLREQYHAREKLYVNTLLFLFDPVIVDRISVVKFTEDFLAMLCQLVNCDIHVDNTRTSHLQVPTEELLRLPFLVLLCSMFKQVFMKLINFIPGLTSSHRKGKRCRFWAKPLIVMKCLSEKDTSRLLKYCHHLNCSLTAVFVTAWSELMSCRTGSAKALCHRKPVTVVVDYRTLMSTELPHSYLSNSSSCFQIQVPYNPQNKSRSFVSTARHCENLMNSAVKMKKHLDLIWQLKYHRIKGCSGQSSPFEIADVGRCDFKQTWPFSLHEIFIGASSTSTVNLTLLVVNNKLYCGMHLNSHFSGCADLLNALFARIVQNMSLNM